MCITHYFNNTELAVRTQNQAAIHRKCLLLLLAQSTCTAVQPARPVLKVS